MEIKVYRCRHCGNIAIKLVDSSVPMVCCAEPMEELSPASVEAAHEKHIPVVTQNGSSVKVDVGSVAHPMMAEHYIEFIILETSNGAQIAKLKPSDEPVALFALADKDEVKRAYAYCNLHGLWVSGD